MRSVLVIAILAAATGGCRTVQPSSTTTGDDRELMGLGDRPLTAVWEEWTPSDGPSTPPALAASADAFDYWQITNEPVIDEAWEAVSAVVAHIRNGTSASYDATFRTLMTVLEEHEGPRRLDVTFVVSELGESRAWEGVIARVYREMPGDAAPGVAVLLRRFTDGAETPTDLAVWLFSSYQEAPSLSVRLVRRAGAWSASSADGIAHEAPQPIDLEAEIVATVLAQAFWVPYTGNAYLESEVQPTDDAQPTPAAHPIAAGLELGDRDIDQVFSDSVFAPRFTGFPPSKN